MYLFTVVGVLMSQYIPLFKEGVEFEIRISWSRFVLSLLLGFALLTASEQTGNPDPAGKRKRFIRRAIAAVTYGSFWYSILGG